MDTFGALDLENGGMNLRDLPVPHEDGKFYSTKISDIVDLVRAYDDRLDVVVCDPSLMIEGDAKFAVTERLQDGSIVIAFYIQDESVFDERVLERIINSDNKNGDVGRRLDAHNMAVRALQAKAFKDSLEEAREEATFLWRHPKFNFNHKGKMLHL